MLEQKHTGLGELSLSSAERRIFMFIRNHSGSSRAEISRELGLAKATVTRAMTKLQKYSLVEERREKSKSSQIGQPNIRIRLRHDEVLTIGVSLSTRGCCVTLANLNCEAVWSSEFQPIEKSNSQIKDQVKSLIDLAVARAGGRANDIGISVPGLFDRKSEIFEITPNQRHIPYEEILEFLRTAYKDFTVTPSGRTNLLFHALEPQNYGEVIFYLDCSDGIGGHIFDRDRPFLGGFNMAGNIGGLVPETGPRPSIPDLAHALNKQSEEINDQLISQLMSREDLNLLEWLKTRSNKLSVAFSSLVQLVNPNKLIFGGNLPKQLLVEISQLVELTAHDVPGRMQIPKPVIEISSNLGDESRALAAASIPLAKFAFASI